MGARVLGRLRGRRGRALIAVLVLVAVVAPIGIWRLAERSSRSADIVLVREREGDVEVLREGAVGAHAGSTARDGHESFSQCGGTWFSWGPRFDLDVAAWSPDGSEVYFTDQGDLQGVTSDGSQRWLIAKNVSLTSFAVAPDGIHLVYAGCRPQTVTEPDGTKRVLTHQTGLELLRVGRDGRSVEQLTANVDVDFYPAWSPNGGRIAFLSDAGRSDDDGSAQRLSLFTMAADGTDVQQVLDDEFMMLHQPPQWSPDGRHLAVVRYMEVKNGFVEKISQSDRELYVVGADGAEPRRLAADVVSGPSWSPDGRRLAYARANADGVALYTIGFDGTDERRVAGIPHWRGTQHNSLPAEAWIDTVAWSPDGTRILVRSNPDHPPFVVRLESGGTTQLRIVSDRNPDRFVREVLAAAWSPDGTHIALVGREYANPLEPDIVATVTADGTDVLVLADKEEFAPWQPVQPNVADAAACRAGVVVPDPDANPELVMDCVALVEFREVLDRRSRPNWSADHRIDDWQGVSVGGTPRRVEALVLPNLSMEARLPDALGKLTGLRTLDLSDNIFWAEIPAALGGLSQLEHLNLGLNALMGPIPPEVGQLTKLRTLDLAHNRLSGEIPRALAELPNLQEIALTGHQLTGCVPPGLPLRDRDALDLPTCEAGA